MPSMTDRPLVMLLTLATWVVLFLLGVYLVALGWIVAGVLVVFASMLAALLLSNLGETGSAPVDASPPHEDDGVRRRR